MKRDKHVWYYEHAVFSDDNGKALVHRYCECGARQWGHVTRWTRMSKADAAERERESDTEGQEREKR